MQLITAESLHDLEQIPRDLFSVHGTRLLPQHTLLTPLHRELLRRSGPSFFFVDNAAELARHTDLLKSLTSREIMGGRVDPRILISLGGRRPAEHAAAIEAHHLDAFAHGVFLPRTPETPAQAHTRRCLEREVVLAKVPGLAASALTIPRPGPPLLPPQPAALAAHDAWPTDAALDAGRAEQVARLRGVYGRLLAGVPVPPPDLNRTCEALIELFRSAPALFLQIALVVPRRPDYLPDHAVGTAALAIAIGARLGWSARDVHLAAQAALLHDIGMFLLPDRIRADEDRLSSAGEAHIRRHPMYSLALLTDPDLVDPAVAWAIYRHHERDDGSGYPDGLKDRQLGLLSQVLAVADVVAAVSEPRPWRAPMLPHEAIQLVVQNGTDGRFNRVVVRALVEAIGLYPIGSFVRLSDGALGQVVGLHPPQADRPIVRLYDEEQRPTGTTVDLSTIEPWELSVIDGVEPPSDQFGGRWHMAA